MQRLLYTHLEQLGQARANALGFAYNAPLVLGQIHGLIANFKGGKNPAAVSVAAVQADVVAHSMGGLITRHFALLPGYLSNRTYGQGATHKVITIDTPHLGTPLATQLLDIRNACFRNMLADHDLLAFNLVVRDKHFPASGAVGDLQGSGRGDELSPALVILRNSATPRFPTAFIAGIVTQANLAPLDDFWNASTYLRNRHPSDCGSDPLLRNLTATGVPTIFGQDSDGIVPFSSQVNGRPISINDEAVFQGYVHSDGTTDLGFGGPSVLNDPTIRVTQEVIKLLNTPVTSPRFTLLP